MFSFLKKKEDLFVSPVKGKVICLKDVNDPVFSQGLMGQGFAIVPENGSVYAPVDGDVVMAFPSGHAYGIRMADGTEVLLHLGIDTVELNGEGFEVFVHQNDRVKKGDLLCKMDLDLIQSKGKVTTCIVIFPNGEKVELLCQNRLVDVAEAKIIKFSK